MRPPGINIRTKNIALMADCRGIPAGMLVIVILILLSVGCTQPEPALSPGPVTGTPYASEGITVTTAPPGIPVQPIPAQIVTTTVPVPSVAATIRIPKPTTFTRGAGQSLSGGYQRYTGAEYSLEYPGEWNTSVARLPLNEYHHTLQGCFASPAYNLDREVRTFTAPDGSRIFTAVIISTDRDIWPRNLNGDIVYADIVNSILGNPATCANSPEGAFTIAGISPVPLTGVSYTGERADFASIDAAGFTKGIGSVQIVTGRSNRGIFLSYRSSGSTGQDGLTDYIFGNIHLDPAF